MFNEKTWQAQGRYRTAEGLRAHLVNDPIRGTILVSERTPLWKAHRMAELLQRDDPNGCHVWDLWSQEFSGNMLHWAEAVRETFEEYMLQLSSEELIRWRKAVS